MKWLAGFMIIYVLVLSLVPCSDHESGLIFEEQCSTIAHDHDKTNNNDTHDHINDTCTPFCTCSCCGIALNVFSIKFIEMCRLYETTLSLQTSTQEYKIVAQYLRAIWQPPQV